MLYRIKVVRNMVESVYKSLKGKSMVETYHKQIDDMVSEGYVESFDRSVLQSPAKCWYLPTHVVLNKDKHSLRIVVDCALTNNCILLDPVTNGLISPRNCMMYYFGFVNITQQ